LLLVVLVGVALVQTFIQSTSAPDTTTEHPIRASVEADIEEKHRDEKVIVGLIEQETVNLASSTRTLIITASIADMEAIDPVAYALEPSYDVPQQEKTYTVTISPETPIVNGVYDEVSAGTIVQVVSPDPIRNVTDFTAEELTVVHAYQPATSTPIEQLSQ